MAKKPMLPFLSTFNSSVPVQLEELIHDVETMKGQLQEMAEENPWMERLVQNIEYSLIGVVHDLRGIQETAESPPPKSKA